jgi:hypothetical protein
MDNASDGALKMFNVTLLVAVLPKSLNFMKILYKA